MNLEYEQLRKIYLKNMKHIKHEISLLGQDILNLKLIVYLLRLVVWMIE